jgi:hypothetical protein
MARKTLLTESEIRQFMKLAKLPAVGTTRLGELTETATAGEDEDPPGRRVYQERSEDHELEDELHATEDELGDEDSLADEEGGELDDLEALDDLEGDELAADDAGMVSVDDFMSALEDALENVLGEPVTVDDEGAGEEAGEDDLEVDDLEMDVELGPEGGEELEVSDEEELVAEVARRVAQRLTTQERSEATIDQLAERIFQRLTK